MGAIIRLLTMYRGIILLYVLKSFADFIWISLLNLNSIVIVYLYIVVDGLAGVVEVKIHKLLNKFLFNLHRLYQ